MQLFDCVGKDWLLMNTGGRRPRALALLEQATKSNNCFAKTMVRFVSMPVVPSVLHLPAATARYRHDYPQLPIELSVGNSQDVMQAVLDLRVISVLLKDRATALKLFSTVAGRRAGGFAAPTSPSARDGTRAVAAAPWILRDAVRTREIVDYLLLSHLPKFEMAMELGNSQAIKDAVCHGLGISRRRDG
ncbi:LysR substrate-binding domain-containing protein [Shigella flexneri]